jgi:predicted branched-subunit amino acid permease
MLPLAVAYTPFAAAIGAAAARSGAALAGWSGSWLIFGGSAHLAALSAADRGVPVAIATGLLLQTRLLIYSSALATRWTDQPRWFRLTAAALVIDPTWAIAEQQAERWSTPQARRRAFLAAAITLGVAWSAAMAVGALAGPSLGGVALGLAAPLCLVALAGPAVAARPDRLPVLAAAVAAVATRGTPPWCSMGAAIAAACATSWWLPSTDDGGER